MKVLVVFSHPVAESFARALLDRCVGDLRGAGHEVTVKDLYAEDFRPALSATERRDYEDCPRNRLAIEDEVAALEGAQGLLLVYPTWWYGMPAMLKGWFDRVWIPGVAFGLDPQRGVSIHTLSRIERLMVVTTYGAPRWFIRLWMGDPGRKVVLRGLKPLLARGCRSSWSALYAMDQATPAQRERFLAEVGRKLSLFSR